MLDAAEVNAVAKISMLTQGHLSLIHLAVATKSSVQNHKVCCQGIGGRDPKSWVTSMPKGIRETNRKAAFFTATYNLQTQILTTFEGPLPKIMLFLNRNLGSRNIFVETILLRA